ncbi:CsgG/HfaB family protein [Aquimarina sp. 2201CG14-23]|uniref:CsgG/HfaB family protein n=1 Tax=Aquimarina mycalae TaxID=3040073 RepID=UPI002477E040|nr:CsgG/HfaB family protein [Aquimarina sp. 2201CG14-23]MDH7444627.1 CsgG/HfaB family protein [Aquimarina sp. 2201CG14-23]
MRHKFYQVILVISCTILLSGCGTYFNQPITIEEARIGDDTKFTQALRNFPSPVEPVVVGVYKFRDQTGQYKPTEAGSTFSTAVTQGATTILIKALEDSKWFVPIERENLSNLLNERNIIRSTRKEYRKNKNSKEPQLPPLLYAGIILEGGIVSYDSNIITGGLGARYFGVGGSTQYRQDRITVYLRAVSTSSGKILKTVYVSKTILSQALDASFFRYVKFSRLLEAETGFTKNEPGQIAVSEAIEKAVESLIVEGIEDKLWSAKAAPEKINALVANYNAEKNEAQNTGLYERYFKERRGEKSVFVNGGMALMSGDYNNADLSYSARIGGKWYFNPYLNANASLSKFELRNEGAFSEGFNAIDVNAELTLLPFEKLTPFFFGGMGTVNTDGFDRTFFKFQYGGGIEYLVNDQIGVSFNATHNLVLGDKLDNITQGKRDDQYFNFSLGLNWYFKTPLKMDKELRKQQRREQKEIKKLKKRNREVIENGEVPKG